MTIYTLPVLALHGSAGPQIHASWIRENNTQGKLQILPLKGFFDQNIRTPLFLAIIIKENEKTVTLILAKYTTISNIRNIKIRMFYFFVKNNCINSSLNSASLLV